MLALLRTFSWQELRHHPWRNAAAVLAVMLGVALAFSVHLINASALSEFSSAVRSAGGQPDLELRAVQGSLDENLYARVAPMSRSPSPARCWRSRTLVPADGRRAQAAARGRRGRAGGGLGRAGADAGARARARTGFAIFAPGTVFLNPAARQLLAATRQTRCACKAACSCAR